ncbi:Acg family FMN-binding oxidoreductase [Polycladidibacter stylochi]|uniref:Acg family FMN-binding oxidoreductase n=1 Tax=Polycladidibacter stylochi TaxID=1807766 RepID=UPI0008326E09|nr:nitroreductase family protein [Pseudovibrio stylochi]
MINRRRFIFTGAAAVASTTTISGCAMSDSFTLKTKELWAERKAAENHDIEYLVHYATLAANNHNTQSWLFQRRGPSVEILPDFERATPIVDPRANHLYASLGCAAENLALAAGANKIASKIQFVGDQRSGKVVVDLGDQGTGHKDPLFDAITKRQSTRSLYDGNEVPNSELELIEAAAAIEGCQLHFITEKKRIETALEFTISANSVQVKDEAYKEELKDWIRFSKGRAIKTSDGLYAACSGNPTMPEFMGKLMFDMFFTVDGENKKYTEQIRSAAGLAILVAEDEKPENYVAVGRAYQRFALEATRLGIKTSLINPAIEVEGVREALATWLGVRGQHPALLIRYGYAPEMPFSLRRPVEDVIISA